MPSPPQTPANEKAPPPYDIRLVAPANTHAHHIHEFGEVDRIVHVASRGSSAAGEEHPVLPVSAKGSLAKNERWRRLGRRLYRERHLMQYFYNDTLFRTVGIRKVSNEELFVDLVIVAAVAALGHQLRESGISWAAVEKFVLLFAAVYSSWRQMVILWNLWGIQQDLVEKAGIYVTFMALTGIALGAHSAFDDVARPYVAVSSFVASALPLSGVLRLALKERLLKNPANRCNELVLTAGFNFVTVLPYFAAAFVRTSRATKALYWTALACYSFLLLAPYQIFKFLHRNIPNHTRIALNIELFVEKYEVLTMIVLGETMIGLLFEAGVAITKDRVRVGLMYLSAVAATAMLYSFQTFYVQVDSPIHKGGKHAIRHNVYAGFIWGFLHMPYHLFLILFATGLSISLRDVAVKPTNAAVRAVVHVSSSAEAGAPQFVRNARWLFAAGWGGSIICSALIGALHTPGPRAATKFWRIIARCTIAVALTVGMPFSELSAGWFQAVFGLVTVVMALTEYLLVQMDRIGFFRSEASLFSSTDSGKQPGVSDDYDDDSVSESSEMDPDFDLEAPREPGEVVLETADGASPQDEFLLELKERMCKGHCSRLVPMKPKRREQDSEPPRRVEGPG